MTAAVLDERDDMLRTIAKHAVDGGYRYGQLSELQLLISNKLGHDLPEKEVKIVEKHIKELRAGRR